MNNTYADWNYDEKFHNFDPKAGFEPNARAKNREILATLGLDENDSDDVFGTDYVYCASHRVAHSVGWCTVRIDAKRPLKGDTHTEAEEHAREIFGSALDTLRA